MADIGVRVNRAALDLFRGEQGLPAALGALSEAAEVDFNGFHAGHIGMLNVAFELLEKATAPHYPTVHLYCEKVTNELREKFRRFSGKVRLTAEARVSQSRMDGLERRSQVLADAITEVLDGSRGDWGSGMFYDGAYEVSFGPVKPGGRNFVQTTKVTFEVCVSAD
jgi:hypothetical protein